MGITFVHEGSVWNQNPAHLHERRSEVRARAVRARGLRPNATAWRAPPRGGGAQGAAIRPSISPHSPPPPSRTHPASHQVYLYYDMPAAARVFHFLGEPQETRHVVVANEQAVLAPPWSLHFGVGTGRYAMLWAMAGENQDFDDREPVEFAQMM